jgi:raffinose/stachyose/melibiose transport system substrate-binding protein
MKSRRLIAVAVTAALVAALTACSSGGAGGKTQLTIWDPGLLTKVATDGKIDTQKSFLNKVAAEYEKDHKNVSIKIVETSGDITKSSAQFQAASIAKNGPDLRVSFTGGNTISYSDFLMNLDKVFPASTVDNMTGWNTVRQGYDPKGKLDALPYGAGSYFYVFYNKKAMASLGIDMTNPPKTWGDLLALGKQIKSQGKTPFWVANQEGYVGAWIMAALVGGQLGANAFTQMYRGKTSIDDPAMVKAYTAYQKLFSEGLTNPDAGSVSNSDSLSGFVQGKGVMYFSGGWDNGSLEQAMSGNVGYFPIPMLSGSKYPSTIAGGPNVAVSITSYTKHQAQAEDFLRYLSEPKVIDQYVQLNQTEASNNKKSDSSVITNPLLKSQAAGIKTTKNVVYPFDNVMPQATIDLFYKLNATVLLGTTTPASAAKQLEAEFTKDGTK